MFQVSLYQNKTIFKTELKHFSSTGKYDKKVKQAKKLNQQTNSRNSNMNIAKNLKKKASSLNHVKLQQNHQIHFFLRGVIPMKIEILLDNLHFFLFYCQY